MNNHDKKDFEFLMENSRMGYALGLSSFLHLDNPIGILNYIRIANDVLQQLPRGDLLDWGCGFGQMSFLLRQRGLEVTSFDIGSFDNRLPNIPLCRNLRAIYTTDKTALPFEDMMFDAVLSCGVLEHVNESGGDEIKSLQQIQRVLRPQGQLFIYQLPQQYAWQEAIIRYFKLGYAHPRRYTHTEINRLLAQNGFQVTRTKRFNFVPKNLTGMPRRLKEIYNLFSRPLLEFDKVICVIPGLNRFAGVLEITAQKI